MGQRTTLKTFKYLFLDLITLTYGEYDTQNNEEAGPYDTPASYRLSGGISGASYVYLPYIGISLMMDTEGHILKMVYTADGAQQGIEVYEKTDAGAIEEYLASNR